jgi:hypothetical protein
LAEVVVVAQLIKIPLVAEVVEAVATFYKLLSQSLLKITLSLWAMAELLPQQKVQQVAVAMVVVVQD